MNKQPKKILNKFEWLLLAIAIGILVMVLLQNRGINMIETTESVKVSKAKEQKRHEEPAPNSSSSSYQSEKDGKERLSNLADYFAQNRAQARAEGKQTGFDWSSLKIPKDEADYLKNRYEGKEQTSDETDWFSIISKSHKTYKAVKSAFNEIGIDTDKIIRPKNASKALSNPIVANSIYNKIEETFGIPAEKSRAFATKQRTTLEEWSKFVEAEIEQ